MSSSRFYQCLSAFLSVFKYRKRVDFEMLRVAKISATELLLSAYRAWSIFSFFSSSLRGLPPRLPLALAACSPAFVLSRMRARSNSASAPKTWKMSLPPELVVSTCSYVGDSVQSRPHDPGLASRSVRPGVFGVRRHPGTYPGPSGSRCN